MTALFSHTLSDTLTVLEPSLREDPVATDPNIVGTRCDHSRQTLQLITAPHDGCPGWWGRHLNDQDALTCACSCHAEQYGWPHWEQAKQRLLGL